MRLLFVLFLIGLVFSAAAQKHDYNWVLGGRFDSTSANVILQFKDSLPTVALATTCYAPHFAANASISDSYGNLLFFTNGINVYDRNFQIIPGALVQNNLTLQYQISGLNWTSFLFLPHPSDTNLYTLFYSIPDTVFLSGPCYNGLASQGFSNHFYYTVFDKRMNNGLGGVVSANNVAFTGLLAMSGVGLAATKHANGRDWWLVIKNACDNGLQLFLFSPTGLMHIGQQNLPYPFNQNKSAHSCMFSPDGSLYSIPVDFNDLLIYKFDRCTGFLSDQLIITSFAYPNLFTAFSSNSRYIYRVIQNDAIVQYDLQDYAVPNAVLNSAQLLGVADTFICPIFPAAVGNNYLHSLRLGPDGKIYLPHSVWCDVISTIEYPDSPGVASTPMFHNFALNAGAAGTAGISVNYRLGALPGSICDSLGVGVAEINSVRNFEISPNPVKANTSFQITYDLAQNKDGIFKLYDIIGREVFNYVLPRFSVVQNFQLPFLSPGLYLASLRSGNSQSTLKLLVTE